MTVSRRRRRSFERPPCCLIEPPARAAAYQLQQRRQLGNVWCDLSNAVAAEQQPLQRQLANGRWQLCKVVAPVRGKANGGERELAASGKEEGEHARSGVPKIEHRQRGQIPELRERREGVAKGVEHLEVNHLADEAVRHCNELVLRDVWEVCVGGVRGVG